MATAFDIVPGEGSHDRVHRRSITLEQPEDERLAACLERDPERLVLVDVDPPGVPATGVISELSRSAAEISSQSAATDRAARQATSAIRRRDACRVRLERETFQGRPDLGRGGPLTMDRSWSLHEPRG